MKSRGLEAPLHYYYTRYYTTENVFMQPKAKATFALYDNCNLSFFEK